MFLFNRACGHNHLMRVHLSLLPSTRPNEVFKIEAAINGNQFSLLNSRKPLKNVAYLSLRETAGFSLSMVASAVLLTLVIGEIAEALTKKNTDKKNESIESVKLLRIIHQ